MTLPNWLTEITGPRHAPSPVTEADADLTCGHAGEPLGERIILTGRVLDSDGRPVPDTLVEIWQANASGRYHHKVDDHPAPLDPNFDGGGRCMTDSRGRYRFITIKPGAYPWGNHLNAWRLLPTSTSRSSVRRSPSVWSPRCTSLAIRCSATTRIFNSIPDPKARERLICSLDMGADQAGVGPRLPLGHRAARS